MKVIRHCLEGRWCSSAYRSSSSSSSSPFAKVAEVGVSLFASTPPSPTSATRWWSRPAPSSATCSCFFPLAFHAFSRDDPNSFAVRSNDRTAHTWTVSLCCECCARDAAGSNLSKSIWCNIGTKWRMHFYCDSLESRRRLPYRVVRRYAFEYAVSGWPIEGTPFDSIGTCSAPCRHSRVMPSMRRRWSSWWCSSDGRVDSSLRNDDDCGDEA